jgi:hypothetical protein
MGPKKFAAVACTVAALSFSERGNFEALPGLTLEPAMAQTYTQKTTEPITAEEHADNLLLTLKRTREDLESGRIPSEDPDVTMANFIDGLMEAIDPKSELKKSNRETLKAGLFVGGAVIALGAVTSFIIGRRRNSFKTNGFFDRTRQSTDPESTSQNSAVQ